MIMIITDYISLIALGVSVITLGYSVYDKRIRLDAYLYSEGSDGHEIEIYNNSSRKVTISYFQLYRSRFKRFSKQDFANTWYDDNDSAKYVIPPYESKNIEFREQYNLDGFFEYRKGEHIYISLFVSGKKIKTIRLGNYI